MKDEEIYNIFDTRKLLNKKPSVLLGKNSGKGPEAHVLQNDLIHFPLPEVW